MKLTFISNSVSHAVHLLKMIFFSVVICFASGCQDVIIGEGVYIADESQKTKESSTLITVNSRFEGVYEIKGIAEFENLMFNDVQMLKELQAIKEQNDLEYTVLFHMKFKYTKKLSKSLIEKLKVIGFESVIFVS